ncbi:MAG: Dyp-type peroxidase [Alcanivoracaceae bacterium]|nr:Dyp-type peroxidase [Alcanivoracaceae bacterium]
MTAFQPAIFDRNSRQHLFLEFIRRPGTTDEAARQALATVVGADSGIVKTVFACGPALCQQFGMPVSFTDFSLDGVVPATQADLFVWLQADHRSHLFDLAMSFRQHLDPVFTLQLEQDGFVYHDMRDLTGFVDGIGNPEGEAALRAALLPEGQAGAGGSFVFAQLWRHDLASFNQLSVAEQENVFGRTKVDAVEFDDERMPQDAHVGRTDTDHDGVPQKIWRRSVPWGASSQHGLYFLAFSCEVERFDYLLRRMYGIAEDGVRDQLTHYSAPQTGSYWYAPTQEMLASL